MDDSGNISRMTNLEIYPLSVLKVKDPGSLWKIEQRKIKPTFLDVVVFHPELDATLRGKNQGPIFVGLHAILEGIHHISKLAYLTDDQIEAVNINQYSEDEIIEWLESGTHFSPWLEWNEISKARFQLHLAQSKNAKRIINR